jgi:hypothetical protein
LIAISHIESPQKISELLDEKIHMDITFDGMNAGKKLRCGMNTDVMLSNSLLEKHQL